MYTAAKTQLSSKLTSSLCTSCSLMMWGCPWHSLRMETSLVGAYLQGRHREITGEEEVINSTHLLLTILTAYFVPVLFSVQTLEMMEGCEQTSVHAVEQWGSPAC